MVRKLLIHLWRSVFLSLGTDSGYAAAESLSVAPRRVSNLLTAAGRSSSELRIHLMRSLNGSANWKDTGSSSTKSTRRIGSIAAFSSNSHVAPVSPARIFLMPNDCAISLRRVNSNRVRAGGGKSPKRLISSICSSRSASSEPAFAIRL